MDIIDSQQECNDIANSYDNLYLPPINSTFTDNSSLSITYSTTMSSLPTPNMFLNIPTPSINGDNINRGHFFPSSFNNNFSITPDSSYMVGSNYTSVSILAEQIGNLSTSIAETEVMDLNEADEFVPYPQNLRTRRNAICGLSSSLQQHLSNIAY